MAITATSLTNKSGFTVNATSEDLSGCEELIAAVSGKRIKVRQVAINSGSAITVTIGAGETAGAVTSPIIGPVSMAANSTFGPVVFNPPIELAAATALVADASGAGNVCIVAQGSVE